MAFHRVTFYPGTPATLAHPRGVASRQAQPPMATRQSSPSAQVAVPDRPRVQAASAGFGPFSVGNWPSMGPSEDLGAQTLSFEPSPSVVPPPKVRGPSKLRHLDVPSVGLRVACCVSLARSEQGPTPTPWKPNGSSSPGTTGNHPWPAASHVPHRLPLQVVRSIRVLRLVSLVPALMVSVQALLRVHPVPSPLPRAKYPPPPPQ